jgi:hypothetical protein
MLTFVAVTTIYAQTDIPDTVVVKGKVRFGIKLGGQISGVSNIRGSSNKRFPGLTTGVVIQVPIPDEETNRFCIVSELIYSQEGEKSKTSENKNIKFYNDYLSLPILMRAYTLDNNLFYIEIGPKISYLIHQKNKRLEPDEARKFDVGLCIGGGINIGGEHKFELGARLNWGLVDIYPNVKDKNKNIGGAIALSYFFGKN